MKQNIKILDEKLRNAKSIAIMAHKNPDGDALCSVLALSHLIEKNYGIKCVCIYDGNAPDYLDNVPLRKEMHAWSHLEISNPFDVAILVDYGAEHQVGGPLEIVKNAHYVIEIDHHKNDNKIATLCLDDENADAVAVVLYQIMKNAKWQDDIDVRDLMAISILTDTGNFKFAKQPETLSIMADLIAGGVSIRRLVELMNNKPRKAVLVEARAAGAAEFFYHNRLAVAIINRRDYRDMDGRGEMVLNLLGQIHGVEYIVLLKEQKENQIGISIRSRGAAIDGIATSFGGGGHTQAAGAVVRGESLENVREKIINAFKGM
ncbi:MAG: DHH family phosphoesterase [Alphaproteobacteria bacterium]|nr:DHH family phosphoesterase [Alphaproteobacteria bacterium]